MNHEKITQRLLNQVREFDTSTQIEEIGTATYIGDGIARVIGLDHVMYGEIVQF